MAPSNSRDARFGIICWLRTTGSLSNTLYYGVIFILFSSLSFPGQKREICGWLRSTLIPVKHGVVCFTIARIQWTLPHISLIATPNKRTTIPKTSRATDHDYCTYCEKVGPRYPKTLAQFLAAMGQSKSLLHHRHIRELTCASHNRKIPFQKQNWTTYLHSKFRWFPTRSYIRMFVHSRPNCDPPSVFAYGTRKAGNQNSSVHKTLTLTRTCMYRMPECYSILIKLLSLVQ